MALIHPRKPWTGSRKRLLFGLPFIILILGLLIYVVFFHIDPATEDLLFPRVVVAFLTLTFVLAGIYSLFRDSWWINLPFNHELFKLVADGAERKLSENNISFSVRESGIMAIVPGRQAKTLDIHTAGPDLRFVIEMLDRKGQKRKVSVSKIMIANICRDNEKEAFAVKKAITEMLYDLKYNSYPSQ